MRELFFSQAKEGDDIIKHLSTIRQLWDDIALRCPEDLPIPPSFFKKLLAYSLPHSWDDFTRQYSRDPTKINCSVPVFIGDCMEHYTTKLKREHEGESSGTTADGNENNDSTTMVAFNSLIKRLGQPTNQKGQRSNNPKCTHCGRSNHSAEDCYHATKPKCNFCKKLGHKEKTCRLKKKVSKPKKDKEKAVADATTSKTELNIAEIRSADDEENFAVMDQDDLQDAVSLGSDFDVIDYDSAKHYASVDEINKGRMYDWLADSGSTNHIANRRDMFISFEPTPGATVHGVGGKTTSVEGHGTVPLVACYGNQERVLNLKDVKYIP
jgi:hypothetical protein